MMMDIIENFDLKNADPKFKDYLDKKGRVMTSVGIASLLNAMVKSLPLGQCYLEVGTHLGSTLLAAGMDHDVPCFGVDHFLGHVDQRGEFESIEHGLKYFIEVFSKGNVEYFKSDYKVFFEGKTSIKGFKAGVYMYDGDHSAENTLNGVLLAMPCLASEAYVVIDDSDRQDSHAVWWAVGKLLAHHSQHFSFVKAFPSEKPNDQDGMWNGLTILKNKR